MKIYARVGGGLAAIMVVAAGVLSAGAISNSSTTATAAASCQKIGFQSGIAASVKRWRTIDPAGAVAYIKLERTLQILSHDHDASCSVPVPPPTTTAPPPTTTTGPSPAPVAPLTYNAEGGSNARYCVAGLPQNAAGEFVDAFSRYDGDGRQLVGISEGRSEAPVAYVKGARSMDGRGPCDPYQNEGFSFPPWPPDSYRR